MKDEDKSGLYYLALNTIERCSNEQGQLASPDMERYFRLRDSLAMRPDKSIIDIFAKIDDPKAIIICLPKKNGYFKMSFNGEEYLFPEKWDLFHTLSEKFSKSNVIEVPTESAFSTFCDGLFGVESGVKVFLVAVDNNYFLIRLGCEQKTLEELIGAAA